MSEQRTMPRRFTPKQGQYLAFIHHYTLIHGQAPAEADMQSYFRTAAPSVHQMVLTLAKNGLVARTPGQARSIVLRVAADELPPLGLSGTTPPAEPPDDARTRGATLMSKSFEVRKPPKRAVLQNAARRELRKLMSRCTSRHDAEVSTYDVV